MFSKLVGRKTDEEIDIELNSNNSNNDNENIAARKSESSSARGEQKVTSIEMFLLENKSLDKMKEFRNGQSGIMLWVDVGIFCFLLFSPILALIPTMKDQVFIVLELLLIGLIGWSKVEYSHRATVWLICLTRGIIVDFPKTHKLTMWLKALPMFFAYGFLLLHALTVYLTLDPDFKKGDVSDILTAVLSILAVLFVLLMTKSFVVIEGANSLLTVNMFSYFFEDANILSDKGFRVVHISRLQEFVFARSNMKGFERTGQFSWNEIHQNSFQADETEESKLRGVSLFCGTRCARFLWPFRDLDA